MATFAVSGRYRESDHIRCMLNADVLTKKKLILKVKELAKKWQVSMPIPPISFSHSQLGTKKHIKGKRGFLLYDESFRKY